MTQDKGSTNKQGAGWLALGFLIDADAGPIRLVVKLLVLKQVYIVALLLENLAGPGGVDRSQHFRFA